MVDALGDVADVEAEDVEAIHAAREAYDELSEDQQAMIDASVIEKLEASEEALVGTISNDILAIGEITADNKEEIENDRHQRII